MERIRPATTGSLKPKGFWDIRDWNDFVWIFMNQGVCLGLCGRADFLSNLVHKAGWVCRQS